MATLFPAGFVLIAVSTELLGSGVTLLDELLELSLFLSYMLSQMALMSK